MLPRREDDHLEAGDPFRSSYMNLSVSREIAIVGSSSFRVEFDVGLIIVVMVPGRACGQAGAAGLSTNPRGLGSHRHGSGADTSER